MMCILIMLVSDEGHLVFPHVCFLFGKRRYCFLSLSYLFCIPYFIFPLLLFFPLLFLFSFFFSPLLLFCFSTTVIYLTADNLYKPYFPPPNLLISLLKHLLLHFGYLTSGILAPLLPLK